MSCIQTQKHSSQNGSRTVTCLAAIFWSRMLQHLIIALTVSTSHPQVYLIFTNGIGIVPSVRAHRQRRKHNTFFNFLCSKIGYTPLFLQLCLFKTLPVISLFKKRVLAPGNQFPKIVVKKIRKIFCSWAISTTGSTSILSTHLTEG